jgi:hypothetical protein
MCQIALSSECLTAPRARLWPRLGWLQTLVLRGGVVGLDADGGHRRFFEREVQPLRSLAGLARAALAGGLVVAGALAGPGRQVTRRRKARHVGADLGQDALRASMLDTTTVHNSSTAGAKGRSCR